MTFELRPVRTGSAEAAALWSRAHPEGAFCAGDPHSGAADGALAVMRGGEMIALGSARSWGRVGTIHGLAVAETARRQGAGTLLLDALVEGLVRRDAAVIGIEVDAGGASALPFLARAGFKPMQLAFVLERAVGEGASEMPAGVRMIASAEVSGLAEDLRGITASADADFDPSAWIVARAEAGDVEVMAIETEEGSRAVVVLPRVAGDALVVTMLVADDGAAQSALGRALEGLDAVVRQRGLARLQIAAPSRYWEATRRLMAAGFLPRASFLRFLRSGHPERADPGRVLLVSWR